MSGGLDSMVPSHRGAEVMETLVTVEHAKLVDYARFRTPDRSKLVIFVLDINGPLSPQTKEFIDQLQAVRDMPVSASFCSGTNFILVCFLL